jgi:ketosteroid isomerase-like protein
MSEEFALPIADPMTKQSILESLQRFAACVREVDYAAARPFWHPNIIVFGTYQELVHGCSRWTETQWDNVWPRTADFSFDPANTAVLTSTDGGMATVITPWTSTGLHADGSRFDRPGRATIIFARHARRALAGHSFAHVAAARRAARQSWQPSRQGPLGFLYRLIEPRVAGPRASFNRVR